LIRWVALEVNDGDAGKEKEGVEKIVGEMPFKLQKKKKKGGKRGEGIPAKGKRAVTCQQVESIKRG